MDSIWQQSVRLPRFPRMQGVKKTDVLIIGGGMAGILCAWKLKEAGVDYMLLEANSICSGITKNTTAKITSQHGFIYHSLIKRFGVEQAKRYLDINEQAVMAYRELCKDMDCGFTDMESYIYECGSNEKIEKELNALDKLNYKAAYAQQSILPFSVAGTVMFRNQAQFNPLQFVESIISGMNIYENTRVYSVDGINVVTDSGRVIAKKVIVATHFPFINTHGSYFLKMYQNRSYMIALENAQNVHGMYMDVDKKGMSFRNYNEWLLIGGEAHRTGKKCGGWDRLRNYARRYYPDSKISAYWAAQDCMTLDGVPYIGQYSNKTPNLFVATGFNKWGMSSSMVAAMILSDLVMDKVNHYADVFSPSRTMLRPQLALNAIEATANLLKPVTRRCPHLGCALKWNAFEHSWDCPCHGSRFEEDGELIDNPATGNLK